MKIVVAGAGVVGLACAYELLQDGHEVTVLDSGRAGQAASHGNAAKVAIAEAGPVAAPGMVLQGLKWMLKSDSPLFVKPSLRPSFVRFMTRMARNCTDEQFRSGLALNLRLAQQSKDMFDEWVDAGLEFEMHDRGVLLAWENADHFRSRQRYQPLFDIHGAQAHPLNAQEVHDVEPALSDRITCGLFYPGDRQIEPDSLTAALVAHITKLGGVVHEGVGVTEFETRGTVVAAVRTTDGERYSCDLLVLAAGVWTRGLAARLGHRIPVLPGKGYSVDYTPAPCTLRTSLTLEDAHVAITPLNGMIRVAGTMEFAGLDDSINATRVAAVKRAAAEGLSDWDPEAPHRSAWAGMRPMTPDGLPIIGPLARGSNTLLATGHAMLGLTQAPATARVIRDLVRTGRDPEFGVSLGRFAGRRNRA